MKELWDLERSFWIGGPESAYSAQCSSTYVRSGEGWQLVAHQQAPLGT